MTFQQDCDKKNRAERAMYYNVKSTTLRMSNEFIPIKLDLLTMVISNAINVYLIDRLSYYIYMNKLRV